MFPLLLSSLLLVAPQAPTKGPVQTEETITLLVNLLHPAGESDRAWVESLGGEVKYLYQSIPAMAVVVPESMIEAVVQGPGVEFVEQDGTCELASVDNTWGVRQIGGGFAHKAGFFGNGVKVATIDTGIDYNHDDLVGLYQGGFDFVNNDADPMDDHFHGTHVAGTIAANLNGVGVAGVAPGVLIWALKGFNSGGSGTISDLIAAVDWTTVNDMDVVNNSWTGSGSTLEAVFQASRDSGVIHVCAAGNAFGLFGVQEPAKYSSTYAISATDSTNAIADFSNRGPEIDLAAPGVDVLSTNLGGGTVLASGTSMACPHVVGVVALVLADGGLVDSDGDGTLFTEVRDRLAKTALHLGAPGRNNNYGHGLVNAQGAPVEPMVLTASSMTAGTNSDLIATGCTPGDTVLYMFSAFGAGYFRAVQQNVMVGLRNPQLLGTAVADAAGTAVLDTFIPPLSGGSTGAIQAFEISRNGSIILDYEIL